MDLAQPTGVNESERQLDAINIIFDGPPGPEAPGFVEVETDDGRSVCVGEWIEREDCMWALRIDLRDRGEPDAPPVPADLVKDAISAMSSLMDELSRQKAADWGLINDVLIRMQALVDESEA